jgi:hypothetical protein
MNELEFPAVAPRKAPNKTEKIAALLLRLYTADPETGAPIPVIDPEWAKTVSAATIVARFERWHEWDHGTARGLGGAHHPANLAPLDRLTHETVKTPADIRAIRRADRLSDEQIRFRRTILAKTAGEQRPAPKPRKSAPMPGTRASPWKHRLDGQWIRREKGA